MTEPNDDAIRQWAREHMKDSQFMYLCADELRLLICHVRNAVLEEYKAQPDQRAKEIVWEHMDGRYIVCACGRVRVCTLTDLETSDQYDVCHYENCENEVCVGGCAKSKQCWVCKELVCHEHMCEMTSCIRCGATLCDMHADQYCNCARLRGCRQCLDRDDRGLICGDRCGL